MRRVKFSPFSRHQLLSCAYDLAVGVWDLTPGGPPPAPQLLRHHSEFATGLDCSLFAGRPPALSLCRARLVSGFGVQGLALLLPEREGRQGRR